MTRLTTNEFLTVAKIFAELAELIGGEDTMELEEASVTIAGTFKGYDVVIGSDFSTINVSIENRDDDKMFEDLLFTVDNFNIIKVFNELSKVIELWIFLSIA